MWNNIINTFVGQSSLDIVVKLLDIIIVYYLIYRVLLFIKGTRTVPMAIGFLLIFVGYYVSKYLGLLTLYSILHIIVSSMFIFFLIIFQDDIRRALIRFGRLPEFVTVQQSQVLDEIIKAAINLAQNRIGALIVIEREGEVDEFIEAGTRLDAVVTRELLYSIFIPSHVNPLHDGAVIIRNYRIYQAGAFLPLSMNPRLDKSLGTRHRAAIGITEHTDAVSVVVSEERGSISICFSGHITPSMDVNNFRRTLLSLFRPRKKKRSFMKFIKSIFEVKNKEDKYKIVRRGKLSPAQIKRLSEENRDRFYES